MSERSIEVSHYIITYYKKVEQIDEYGETKIIRKKDIEPLEDLDRTVEFDRFLDSIKWVNNEICTTLEQIWQNFPSKNVYLSKSMVNATLDIKLNNCGWPKTIYRVQYRHHRNDIDDES